MQQATFAPQATMGHVLCCMCGCSIPSNPSNMCISCIRSQVDITEGVQKQVKAQAVPSHPTELRCKAPTTQSRWPPT